MSPPRPGRASGTTPLRVFQERPEKAGGFRASHAPAPPGNRANPWEWHPAAAGKAGRQPPAFPERRDPAPLSRDGAAASGIQRLAEKDKEKSTGNGSGSWDTDGAGAPHTGRDTRTGHGDNTEEAQPGAQSRPCTLGNSQGEFSGPPNPMDRPPPNPTDSSPRELEREQLLPGSRCCPSLGSPPSSGRDSRSSGSHWDILESLLGEEGRNPRIPIFLLR